jgi:hypothetical protein
MRSRSALAVLCCLLLISVHPAVRAALPDEIQVYTDDINAKGEFGLELHVNTTPRGLNRQDYPGEVTTSNGLRITPEFSYGLSEDFEAGLYLPTSYNGGNYSLAGYKLRLKWLPLKPDELKGGFFAGANGELSNINGKFETARHNFELRLMGGYRNKEWLVAVNPVFGWALSSSQVAPRPSSPDFSLGYKVARTVAPEIAVGFEYYNDKGAWSRFDAGSAQGKTVFAVLDFGRKPLPFNLGIGRGINGSTDKWTVKAIFEVPFR